MDSNIKGMIDSVRLGNSADASSFFETAMKNRLNAALDERKIAVAAQIYGGVNESVDDVQYGPVIEGWGGSKPMNYRSKAVLPIGSVHLTTHSNSTFGNVFHGWEKNSGSNILVHHHDFMGKPDGKMKVIHTAGDHESVAKSHPAGHSLELHHDQTGRRIGEGWKVHSVHPHSEAGMESLKKASGKGSLHFATYK